MYCLKCKIKTESDDIQEKITNNNRRIETGSWRKCGRKKSQFISNKSGKGIVNDILSKVGNTLGKLHLSANQGEYVNNGSFNNQKNFSYCGSGTKYEQRNRESYKGINELDRACKKHDQFYSKNTDTASRNISDEALAHRALEIANDSRFDSAQRNMAKLVYHIMTGKAKLCLGQSKSLSRELDPSKN